MRKLNIVTKIDPESILSNYISVRPRELGQVDNDGTIVRVVQVTDIPENVNDYQVLRDFTALCTRMLSFDTFVIRFDELYA